MAWGGRRLPIHLLGLLWIPTLTFCFNLEPRMNHIYNFPEPFEREPYFGFSVALQHSHDNTNWLMVGAPRANSTYHGEDIPEPGVLFKCDLKSDTCEELIVDQTGNTATSGPSKYRYKDRKNYGWLGGSLDTQPDYMSDRQATCVSAPLWKNQRGEISMPGVLYITYGSISTGSFTEDSKKTPLIDRSKIDDYGFGQAGFSVHFPANDSTKLVVGAPGAFSAQGSVILFEDVDYTPDIGSRKKRDVNSFDSMFLEESVLESDQIEGDGLLGYSVTSGYFLHTDKTHYAAGAPQGAHSHGKVIIFEINKGQSSLLVKKELIGMTLGEYFGAAVTAADINGDGLHDLVVGSPMYFYKPEPDIPDIGRIQTFLSKKGNAAYDDREFHYGMNNSFARFGTSLTSLGDLNADKYEDIAVGAPWDDNGAGAVYIFLGSPSGLRHQYSQRLSPEDFIPDLRGFGVSLSRGTDVDDNGYADLAIGNFLSGHALVVKSRPVAELSGTVTATPSFVAWEDKASVTLETCLTYTGHLVPSNLTVQGKLILDYGSITLRAFFTDNKKHTNLFLENLLFNETQCRDHQVIVKKDKINPNHHITMRLEYEVMDTPDLELKKRPLTDPTTKNNSMAKVHILKECNDKICMVNMKTQATFVDSYVVIGKMNKLRVEVSNIGEPEYVPTMTVTADPFLILTPVSHDCMFHNDETETVMKCILPNFIKNGTQPEIVEVHVEVDEESQLMENASYVNLQVNVSGQGEELEPDDNIDSMILQLAAEANLELKGSSQEEQLIYEFTDDQIIVTNNSRFNHTYVLVKKGPTSLRSVDLTIDIPISFTTDESDFVKVYAIKKKFSENFTCNLVGTQFVRDNSSSINPAAGVSVTDENSGVHSSSGSQTVSAKKGEEIGTQHFNCSSSLIRCAQLTCQIPNWTVVADSAKVILELEVDLTVLAKHISVNGGAIFGSRATARIQSLNHQHEFIGKITTNGEAVTYIQPNTLLGRGTVPWWVILLAVLFGFLVLGLVSYGLHKNGFFKRQKMDEMKAHRANLGSSPVGEMSSMQ